MRLIDRPRHVSTSGDCADKDLRLAGYEFLALTDGDHRPPVFHPLLQYVVAILLLCNGCGQQSCKAGSESVERFSATGVILLAVPRHVQVNCPWDHFVLTNVAEENSGQFFGSVQRHFNPHAAFFPFRVNVDGLRDFRLQFEFAVCLHDFCISQAARLCSFDPVRRRQWRAARDDPGC